MNDGGILFTAVDKRIFNECSIKIHRIACMRAINSFPINTTRRSPLLGILIKSKRESFSVRFSKLEKYFILLTQVWARLERTDCSRGKLVQEKQKNGQELISFYFQVVKGTFGARRSKYLRQADPTFAELNEEPQPVTQNGFNSSKNGYKVRTLIKYFFLFFSGNFTFCLNCGN